MGQQLGLRGFGVGKSLLQHPGNLLVELLAAALEQRLIRSVLNQGMLEEVSTLRWRPPLVEQFCCDQLLQSLL